MSYFLLTCYEGHIGLEHYTDEKALLKHLREYAKENQTDLTPQTFLDYVPTSDECCWEWNADDDAVLIIKGDIIQPLFKQVVTKIELPE